MLHIHKDDKPTGTYALSTKEVVFFHSLAKVVDQKTEARSYKDSLKYLHEDFVAQLDPAGVHLLDLVLPQGLGTRWGFHRAMIYAKVRANKEPQMILLDLEKEQYDNMREHSHRHDIELW